MLPIHFIKVEMHSFSSVWLNLTCEIVRLSSCQFEGKDRIDLLVRKEREREKNYSCFSTVVLMLSQRVEWCECYMANKDKEKDVGKIINFLIS